MLNILSVTTSMGQDAVYSQFYANPLYLNPSLAGATMSKRLAANYRNQWPSLNSAFTSYSISYDQYIDALSGGIGVLVTTNSDVGGLLSSTSAHLMYSYRLQIAQNLNMNFGLGAGIHQRSIDWSSLVFENPESEVKLTQTSRIVPDFNLGTVLGYKDLFYAGFALHQVTQPVISFYNNNMGRLCIKYTAHVGGNIFFDRFREYNTDEPPKVVLSPAAVYIRQDASQQINVGMNLTIYPFVFGAWYRNAFKNPDAIIALVGFCLRGFQFGYSYDATISKFSNATGGAHEISLGYRFAPSKLSKRTVDKQRAIPCPKF